MNVVNGKQFYERAKEQYSSYREEYDKLEEKDCNAALILSGWIKAIEQMFPQISEDYESKDEKIRKAIVNLILSDSDIYKKIGYCQSDCLTWLKKQSKNQASKERIEPKFKIGERIHHIFDHEIIGITDIYYVCDNGARIPISEQCNMTLIRCVKDA